MKDHRIFSMTFGTIYAAYKNKVLRKGRTEEELNKIITWMTGYDSTTLQNLSVSSMTMVEFFTDAPKLNPNRLLITGLICGVRVELVEDPRMKEIRYLDKLVDELARGKQLAVIFRTPQ